MILKDTAEYRSFLGEGADHTAEWAVYRLTGVLVRERGARNAEDAEHGETTIYFFPSRSLCTDSEGNPVLLPRMRQGDRVRLVSPDGAERLLRVKEEAIFDGGSEVLAHVRLRAV